MKKTLIVFATATMLTTSIGFASPLTNYVDGCLAVDLSIVDNSPSLNGVTIGLSENFAIQYNKLSSDVLQTNEVNVLYQLNDGENHFKPAGELVAFYIGVVQNTGTIITNGIGSSGETSSEMQLGVVGSTRLTPKMTAYASMGTSYNCSNFKIGLSQKVTPNFEANVEYHYIQANKLTIDDSKTNISTNGTNCNVTYKF